MPLSEELSVCGNPHMLFRRFTKGKSYNDLIPSSVVDTEYTKSGIIVEFKTEVARGNVF